MFRKILIRASYLAFGGFLALVFLLIAQVNLDDWRLKAGNLRVIPDPALKAGGIYSILPGGRVAGPHCTFDQTILAQHYRESNFAMTISNTLGASLPLLSRWTKTLVGGFGVDGMTAIINAKKVGYAGPGIDWTGHTLVVPAATLQAIKSTSSIERVVTDTYAFDSDCEQTIAILSLQGHCVTLISGITSVAGQKIGYKPADEFRCIFPNFNSGGRLAVPRQPMRFTAYLSRAKDAFGILDFKIPDTE